MSPVIYVVDDNEAVRRSLSLLLGALGHHVHAFESGPELLSKLDPHAAGCIITDFRMPGMDGLALLEALHERSVALPVVLVTGHADVRLAVRAMQAGAVDVVEKPYLPQTLLSAVELALARDPVAPSATTDAPEEAARRVAMLSPRERQVLIGLIAGQSNKVMALSFGISPRTVEIHRAHVMEKLGVRSLAEAVRIGIAAGLDAPALPPKP